MLLSATELWDTLLPGPTSSSLTRTSASEPSQASAIAHRTPAGAWYMLEYKCRSSNQELMETISINHCSGMWSCWTQGSSVQLQYATIEANHFQYCSTVRSTQCMHVPIFMHYPVPSTAKTVLKCTSHLIPFNWLCKARSGLPVTSWHNSLVILNNKTCSHFSNKDLLRDAIKCRLIVFLNLKRRSNPTKRVLKITSC